MHVEAVSEGEKPQTDDDKIDSEEEKQKFESEDEKQVQIAVESETEQTVDTTEDGERPPELLSDHPLLSMAETLVDSGLDVERPDTELEERSMSPSMTQKRRSRSRGSKDLKGKLWLPPSPMPQPTGDTSASFTCDTTDGSPCYNIHAEFRLLTAVSFFTVSTTRQIERPGKQPSKGYLVNAASQNWPEAVEKRGTTSPHRRFLHDHPQHVSL